MSVHILASAGMSISSFLRKSFVAFGLFGSIIFTHIISHDVWGEKYIEYKMCVLIFPTTFVRNISYSKNN